MAMLMYEYIRGAFRAVRRTEIRYDVHKFHNDIEQICIEANSVDFDGILHTIVQNIYLGLLCLHQFLQIFTNMEM